MKLRYKSLVALIGLILSIPSPSSWAASSTLDDCNDLAREIGGDFDTFSSNSESLGSCLRERQWLSLVCKSSSHENLAVLVILSTAKRESSPYEGFYFPKFEVWINNNKEIKTSFSVTEAWANGVIAYLEIDENQNEQTFLLDRLYLVRQIVEDGQELTARHHEPLLTIDPDNIFNENYTEINQLMVDNSLSLDRVGDYFTINRTDGSYVSVNFPGTNGEKVVHQGSCTVAEKDNFSTIWDILSKLTSLYQENISKELEEMKSSRKF